MKYLLILTSMFFLLISCKKGTNYEKNTNDEEISSKIEKLYQLDNPEKLYPLPENFFTTNLSKLLNEAKKITDQDFERIKNSDTPTDKPLSMDSFILSNIMDKDTGYSIRKITINKNLANVDLELEYNYDENNMHTKEINVQLINENGWKIDNIVYNKIDNSSLKTNLEKFQKKVTDIHVK